MGCERWEDLVFCPQNSMPFVAIKMGRRQGARRAHPAPFYAPADLVLSRRYQNGAGRNRRATQPPAHFQRNPQGRGRLAVFLRCSLGPYRSRYGRFARALKNSQLTCGETKGI
jgi:hypothetical protein